MMPPLLIQAMQNAYDELLIYEPLLVKIAEGSASGLVAKIMAAEIAIQHGRGASMSYDDFIELDYAA